MRKTILLLMVGILLIGVNLYAAGDLIVNGKLGVGISAPTSAINAENTDESVLNVNAIKNTGTWLNGSFIKIKINSSNVGANALIVAPSVKTIGSTGGIARGALFNAGLGGSGTITSVTGMQNQIRINTANGDYTIDTMRGNELILTNAGIISTNNHTITNYYGINSYGVNAAPGEATISGTNWRHAYFQDFPDYYGTITNIAGLWIDQQTRGTNNYGIVLNGDGAGADIVFGASQEASIYSSAGELWVKDGLGNTTQISPHDPETGEWIFYSKNVKTGRVVRINMEKLVKAVESLTGETFMVETLTEK